jgi:hypothetical protein
MPLLQRSKLKALGQQETIHKSFNAKKQEVILEQASKQSFDIFLSHAFSDKDVVIGIREYLLGNGYSVYIDWIDDNELERNNVSLETAGRLKERMNQSKCLLFATTENYQNSKWMPWELGYFDGGNGKVAILPIVDSSAYSYNGTEYLGLYPYTTEGSTGGLYIVDSENNWKALSSWMNGN